MLSKCHGLLPAAAYINKPFWSIFDVEILKIRVSEVSVLRNVPAPGMEPRPAGRACAERADAESRAEARCSHSQCFLCARLIAALTALPCPAVTRASYQHQICCHLLSHQRKTYFHKLVVFHQPSPRCLTQDWRDLGTILEPSPASDMPGWR